MAPRSASRTKRDHFDDSRVDQNSIKYISHDNTESNWVAPEGPLHVPESNLDLLDFGRSTGTSMVIFVRGVGVGLTRTANLVIKN